MSDSEAARGGAVAGGGPLHAVSGTAISVAEVRARESARPNALFHDPFADVFARRLAPLRDTGGAPPEFPDEDAARRARARAFHVIIRTCFYDDFLMAAAGTGIRQVVLVGAGLDSRAFRLSWPSGMTIFEVDLPAVLAAKQQVLDSISAAPRAQRRVVAADLTQPLTDPLQAAGFDPGAAVAWLAEGVLIYLAAADVHRLLAEITTLSVRGSQFAAEAGARRPRPGTPSGVEALWRSGGDDGPDAVLPRLGWSVEVESLGDVASGFGRPVAAATSSALMTARRG